MTMTSFQLTPLKYFDPLSNPPNITTDVANWWQVGRSLNSIGSYAHVYGIERTALSFGSRYLSITFATPSFPNPMRSAAFNVGSNSNTAIIECPEPTSPPCNSVTESAMALNLLSNPSKRYCLTISGLKEISTDASSATV